MNFRRAITSDLLTIQSLWKEVFFDSEDYINRFIVHFGIENCYVCEINRKIAAMAFALPTTLSHFLTFNFKFSTLNLKYIYACATHPNYRRQGVMEKLLATIYDISCNENIAGVFLHAADENLANYYRKLGFQDFFYRNSSTFNRKGREEGTKHTMKFLTPDEYSNKRIQKLEKQYFANWNEDFFRFLNETGVQFCEYENTIFSFRTEDSKLIVDELLSNTPEQQIANLLFEQFPDCESIDIRTTGNENCCGQMKWNQFINTDIRSGYFAFALE
ncbi:MAG: GNAT family N-acetyltransferase [Bacteroidetes bacterium]|nr:GNAT family N-acetyltransferase [Bacteroidota bacterium]MCL1969280.1 GNAT family N-acetyltransferase [Bacteroidota bacterium]